jgi:phosphoribosylformimino-5-aminoimidazole carboxamide ribotide isomerase
MRFRPCIDIHNGKVKQIVGGSLKDNNDYAKDNFISEKNADYYAELYKKDNLKGGHIILLNPVTSQYYNADVEQALLALKAYPQGMQIGGGITDENASFFLENGASHVIVTSYVFSNGVINYDNLKKLFNTVGKDKLVLDLSCRKKNNDYYIVTNRWQTFTDVKLSHSVLDELSRYCDEFLVHAVDVEGNSSGIDEDILNILSEFEGIPITYAGGVSNFDDLEKLRKLGKGKIDVTIGSSLDLFGGKMEYKKVIEFCK